MKKYKGLIFLFGNVLISLLIYIGLFLLELPKGIEYIEKTKDQITVKVNTEIIGTQKALQELTKIYNIDDVDIQNESLEDIIRGIYEED